MEVVERRTGPSRIRCAQFVCLQSGDEKLCGVVCFAMTGARRILEPTRQCKLRVSVAAEVNPGNPTGMILPKAMPGSPLFSFLWASGSRRVQGVCVMAAERG